MNLSPPALRLLAVLFVIAVMITPQAYAQEKSSDDSVVAREKTDEKEQGNEKGWVNLVGHWKACQFGGEGEVTIKDGVITMEYGDPLTGVVWEGPFEGDKKKSDDKSPANSDRVVLPRDNYEIRWECKRTKGFDFMCAFTFPVAENHASLVMGGWGGGITGISSIDGFDASDNNTTMFKNYDDNRWYKARVRVDSKKITVWVDGKEMFDHDREGHTFDIRFEMDPCTPLGIANFECDSHIRNVQLRRLAPAKSAVKK